MPDIYRDLDYTADQVDEAIQTIGSHVANNAIHVNQSEKDNWNAKADSSALSAETSARETADTALQTAVNSKADASALTSEISARETADASINSRISAIETDQQRQETEIGAVAALGAKNLLEFDGCSASSTTGVSYTINADGTVTVNGTPQGSSPSYVQLMLRNDAVRVEEFCDGSHILSGCPNGGSDSSYRMYVAKGSYSRFDYGDGVLLTKTTQTDVRVVIYIAKGYTANNLVFKPMIRRAEITDSTYAPYAPTNRELYEMILALQSGRSLQSAPASLMQAGRLDAAEQTNINDPIADSDM